MQLRHSNHLEGDAKKLECPDEPMLSRSRLVCMENDC